jgi:hypothetical protein
MPRARLSGSLLCNIFVWHAVKQLPINVSGVECFFHSPVPTCCQNYFNGRFVLEMSWANITQSLFIPCSAQTKEVLICARFIFAIFIFVFNLFKIS